MTVLRTFQHRQFVHALKWGRFAFLSSSRLNRSTVLYNNLEGRRREKRSGKVSNVRWQTNIHKVVYVRRVVVSHSLALRSIFFSFHVYESVQVSCVRVNSELALPRAEVTVSVQRINKSVGKHNTVLISCTFRPSTRDPFSVGNSRRVSIQKC